MLFDVIDDIGSRISVYVIPDSISKTPSLRVFGDGAELLVLAANEDVPTLVASGRHVTGRCAFKIDDGMIPHLAAYADLELIDLETGLVIYRRRPESVVEDVRMFRLETHLLPLWRLDDVMRPRFHYWYKGIDRFGRETTTQLFYLKQSQSIYASGRILYKNYEVFLRRGLRTITMIRDPYDELAERLIVLKNLGEGAEQLLGARDALTFAPVIDALADFEEFDEEFCKKFFKKASKAVSDALSSPVVRQLTVSSPDQLPSRSAVAASLEVLASLDMVGIRSRAQDFCDALAETLGLSSDLLPLLSEYTRVSDLGDKLRETRGVETLLDQDLELFHILCSAYATVGL